MHATDATDPQPDPQCDPPSPLGGLWPSPDYARQIERLSAAVGETVYLAELTETAVALGVRLTDRPYVLLGVLDFPRPDPIKGLAPHLVLLDDGRGVNLGRIARIARNRPFAPAPADVLFQDPGAVQTLLFQERQLSPESIAQRSRAVLGEMLGARLASPATRLPGPDATHEPPNQS
jgi:hypothetical protein